MENNGNNQEKREGNKRKRLIVKYMMREDFMLPLVIKYQVRDINRRSFTLIVSLSL